MQLHLPKNTYFAKFGNNLIDASMLLVRANCTNKHWSITDKQKLTYFVRMMWRKDGTKKSIVPGIKKIKV